MLSKTFKQCFTANQRVLSTRAFASSGYVTLPKNSNQARGLADFAIDFMSQDNKKIADEVYDRV